jgi:predicted RNA-binding protein with EMAP domain
MFILADLKMDDGQTVAVVMAPPKEFKTGSRGFYGTAKAEIGGKRYQVQIQVIEIGSKKTAAEEADPAKE